MIFTLKVMKHFTIIMMYGVRSDAWDLAGLALVDLEDDRLGLDSTRF